MFEYDLDRMLFTLAPDEHDAKTVESKLNNHPEVKFVSFTGVDLGNHSTDEKIPIKLFMGDMEKILWDGVQTDGSSVALPLIAELSNARVDILPDKDVNWYVEYNLNNIDFSTGLPVGTLRIPSFLRHNGDRMVDSRIMLRHSAKRFRRELESLLREHPYVFNELAKIEKAGDIKNIVLTNATELEFWVKTPDDRADRDQLFTSQELQESYWRRTVGPVETALEQTIELLEKYGFGIEMGHKEVGGVRAKMGNSGNYDHIMEQLEIDWKYTSPMQAADNEVQIKNIVKDVFRANNLEATFLAKPVNGVAGSGEHTHFGVAAELRNGKRVNLFENVDREGQFMSPIGYGALMGILRNYEIINPFVSATHDAFRRLQPGYEAPVCIVTSLGTDHRTPSRNRTVLAGLIRDMSNPLSTRFELRSPNPHSNSYLVMASVYMAMLDGIRAVLEAEKSAEELEKSISKECGDNDFYLEKDRQYRSEKNIYTAYSREERERLFGRAPATVWENFKAFDEYEDRMHIFEEIDDNTALMIRSYRKQMTDKWATEFCERIIPNSMDYVRKYVRRHGEDATDYDIANWERINELRNELAKDSNESESLLMAARRAVDEGDYDRASDLEIKISEMMEKLHSEYNKYRRNLF